MLWPLETRTIPAAAVREGLVAGMWANRITVAGSVLAVVFLWPLHGLWALVLAVPLARLLALDMTAYLLPHLYTVHLIGLGVVWGQGLGSLWVIIPLLVAREVVMRLPKPIGLSGGDFMLLAVMVAWLPVHQACIAATLGCVLWLPVAFLYPKRDIPLGVPLIAGWLVFSAGAALQVAASWPIYQP